MVKKMKKKMVIALILLAAMCQTGCGSLGDIGEGADRWPEEEEYVSDGEEEDEKPDTDPEEDEGEDSFAGEESERGQRSYSSSYTPEASLAARERTIYVDGRKVPMPKTVGDVEKLSGVRFKWGARYSNDSVMVTDEDEISYVFNIKFCELSDDEEERLEQIRNTELTGLSLSSGEEIWKCFSMLPEKAMFGGEYQEVTKELIEIYGDYIKSGDDYGNSEYDEIEESGNIEFDCMGDGYTMSWGWSSDSGSLRIEYLPDNYAVFYQYLTGTLPEDMLGEGMTPFPEFLGVDEDIFGMCFGDITGDGVREIILDNQYNRMGVAYDPTHGCLQKLFEVPLNSAVSYGESVVTNGSGMGWLLLEQGRNSEGMPVREFTEISYEVKDAFLLDVEGNFTLLAHLEGPRGMNAGDYSVNGVIIDEEEYVSLWNTYGGNKLMSSRETTVEEALEDMENLVGADRVNLWKNKPENNVPEPYGEYPAELTLYGREYDYFYSEGEPYDEIEEGYDETDE